ncbi:Pentalenene oxygenase [compost metagenome]
MFAGHETSATNLGHLFTELAKNPDIQEKCIEEVDRVLEGRTFTYDDFSKFTYMNNCVKESLRKHSAVDMLPKTPKSKDVICGYTIPKDTFIWVDVYRVHLNSANWKDPNVFNPDRFNERYDPLSYLPFSFGARKCVGFQFSLVETLAIAVKLLQSYRFELEQGKDAKTYYPREQPLVTVKIAKENLVMKKRGERIEARADI